jgi:PAS domain-containing protein
MRMKASFSLWAGFTLGAIFLALTALGVVSYRNVGRMEAAAGRAVAAAAAGDAEALARRQDEAAAAAGDTRVTLVFGNVLLFAVLCFACAAMYRAARRGRHSEERYRSLVELSPDAIFITRGGRFAFTNGGRCSRPAGRCR